MPENPRRRLGDSQSERNEVTAFQRVVQKRIALALNIPELLVIKGSKPRFSNGLVFVYRKHLNSAGIIITWDMSIPESGLVPDEFVKQPTVLGEAVKKAVAETR